jgi:carbonic anhydrase
MQKLVRGIHHFQENLFNSQRERFELLADGQHPEALFITCSDSRINPNLITHTEPGDLFIIRNAGNLVPPFGAANGGEAATIEFAIVGLGVQDIIICGHSHCGAMKGLLHPETLSALPTMASWLSHAEGTRWIARQRYANRTDSDLLNIAIQENVLVQLENLRTHPAVAVAVANGKLKLHGWVYKFETGQVFSYSPQEGQFISLAKSSVPEAVTRKSPHQVHVI